MNMHNILMQLSEKHTVCSIAENGKASTWAGLFRYQPFLDSDKEYFEKYPDACYVFEIGKSCGTVFSEKLVESIEMTKSGAIIHLKR